MYDRCEAVELLRSGLICQAESCSNALFKVGDRVRAKVIHPLTYTRLPQYVRGKLGTILKDRGVYVFPDTVGQRLTTKPQHVYSVRFAAQELWGADVSENDCLFLDLFDDHLEAI
jgi:Nitrile hydratase beta subunit